MFNYLCIALAAASVAFAETYEMGYSVPWTPKKSTSVDQGVVYNGTYYLSDRTNKGVQVLSLNGTKQTTLIPGFAGQFMLNGAPNYNISGPNGVVVLSNRNELYVGDGKGTVRIIDLSTNTIVSNVSFGITTRADEMAYDSHSGTVVVTLPNEVPPQVGVISATDRKLKGKVTFPGASGLEQPVFDEVTRQFYVSVPSTGANPGGEIAQLDISSLQISHTFPLDQCIPAGIVFGPGQHLLISCSSSQIDDYGVAYSQVMDMANGNILANVSGIAGSDQVAYDPNAKLYFISAYQNQVGGKKTGAPMPQLAVVNATTNAIMQIWATDSLLAHSVAVDATTNQVVVPRQDIGIVVYNLATAKSNSTSSVPSSTNTPVNAAPQWGASGALLLGGLVLTSYIFHSV